MNECVFIYRTYHIVSQGGLQFYLSEIGRQLVEAPLRILKVRHYYVDVYTMISLMQYRASVGLHDNFLKAKELSRCVKGQFWSTLLFMFYLETILAFISETSTFVANELLRWPLVLSNVALSLLLSVIN